MLNDPNKEAENEPIEVLSYYIRQRNALAVRGDFGVLYRDYYLHLMQHGIRYGEDLDAILKEAIAGLTLHLASRPWREAIAWTMSWQSPPFNLFVTGSNRQGNVTGRVFTEDIRPRDSNLFFSQTTADGEPSRQSTIEPDSLSMFETVEQYYKQSEQRPARIFRYADEDFVLIAAQPDCDLPWFESLSDSTIRNLDRDEELSLLERRSYVFDCGCDLFKLLPVIDGLSPEAQDEVFGDRTDATVSFTCPRCGAVYGLTREMLEAYQENKPS